MLKEITKQNSLNDQRMKSRSKKQNFKETMWQLISRSNIAKPKTFCRKSIARVKGHATLWKQAKLMAETMRVNTTEGCGFDRE